MRNETADAIGIWVTLLNALRIDMGKAIDSLTRLQHEHKRCEQSQSQKNPGASNDAHMPASLEQVEFILGQDEGIPPDVTKKEADEIIENILGT